ncbi:haloacid dehalogenase [Halobellus salinus]|uniref:Haloacid dehalogenase n=1 Tax=Halobellus salinus TaxID=931585 RepID=A0A830EJ50_9EURY|nr:HAD hydrolase family protein [Halobellus salinus]GGJ10079.1 haloacid dehalogenase [Halobellus salinus]SMP24634.1 haloacid dehalogenase-like hydrolase [Halobellus salinus]
MDRYDLLYRLYDETETDTLRDLRDFVDLFPPVDSRVALEYWEDASDELDARKREIEGAYPQVDILADIAARATREQTFTAVDLHSKYGRRVNALVLDVDETLRSAGRTDNEIPRETLHLLTELHESGLPIVICTGQTLENVKGFMIQGLGTGLVHSGSLSIVYEAGTGVFTPGHGSDTKRLLYEGVDESIRSVFSRVRSRVLTAAPPELRQCVHLQGNEFNVTLKPNFDVGSDAAERVIDQGLVYLVDLLGRAVVESLDVGGGDGVDSTTGGGTDRAADWARAYYADADPEIAAVLEGEAATPEREVDDVPGAVGERFDRIDVAYYHADAAEIGSLDLDKPTGVRAALDVLEIDDPFVVVMGDSKSDLRVMEWADRTDSGIAAAPSHASASVLDHVRATDELVYDPGDAGSVLRIASVLNRLDEW